MHSPRPYGSFGAANEDDAAAADLLMNRLGNIKETSNLASLRMARTLPSGAIAIAYDMGGVRKVLIQPPRVEPPLPFVPDGLAKGFVPMMFSGVIDKGVIRHGDGTLVKFSGDTRKRLAGYDPKKLGGIPQSAVLKRFVVELSQRFGELMPNPAPKNFTFTQYANLRPTWFSGAMAEVVQIVGGYGLLNMDELPNTPLERARYSLPAKVQQEIERELSNLRLPGYTGLPHKDGQIRYDYKYNETHAVGFDRGDKPWLVRISTAGVYVMPLPLIPATTTKAFRKHVDEKQDKELIWVLDRFGGMPSGEAFPSNSSDFQAWRRAGVIIKVCDVGDFYQHMMYSSAMGWSMNSRGNEGFNTCYDFDDKTQVTTGYAYKLKLSLGTAKDDGKLPPSFDLEDPEDARRLDAYLSKLYGKLGQGTARELAIKYKLRRIPVAEILTRAGTALGTDNIQSELDYWENLEAAPIASHGGSVSQVGAGPVAWRLPGFKFPEPFMQGCISFESLGRPLPGNEVKRADTILAGYYVGDELKVIKYFTDDREYKREVEDNYEDCMTVGSWDRTITEGSTSLMGAFYTSDFDDREAAAETITKINIVGTDLGYDTQPHFAFDDFFARPGTLWRHRYFKHRTKTERTTGYRRIVAVCMPYLQRNAVIHVRTDEHTGKEITDGTERHSVTDPYTYRYWTYDFVWAWRGSVTGPQAGVSVYPKDGNPVWVVQENYAPSVCSDFADNGPWIPGLPADYTWLIHPNQNEWRHSGGGGTPSVNEGSVSTREEAKTVGQMDLSQISYTLTVSKKPAEQRYFLFSPDPYIGVFYRDAVAVTAGECEYGSVSEKHPSMENARAFQGWCRLADHSTAHHFIGVINE